MDSLTASEWIMIVAVFTGPGAAVFIARELEKLGQKHSRRLSLFRSLMATRRTPTSPEHVTALNTIEVEFYREKEVIISFKKHMDLMPEQPRIESERVDFSNMSEEEVRKRNNYYELRIGNLRQDSLASLLHSISKSIGMPMDKHDVFRGGYHPEAFANMEMEQRAIRNFVIGLALHERSVPVTAYAPPAPPQQGTGSENRQTEQF